MACSHCHHRNGGRGSDDSATGCLAIVLLALVAMPIVGIYMLLTSEDSDKKTIGAILLIVGIIIWAVAGQG